MTNTIALISFACQTLALCLGTQVLLPINSNLLLIYSNTMEKYSKKLVSDILIPSNFLLLPSISINLDLANNSNNSTTKTFQNQRHVGRKMTNSYTVILLMLYNNVDDLVVGSHTLESRALTKTMPLIHGDEDKVVIITAKNWDHSSSSLLKDWQNFLLRFKYKRVITCPPSKNECLFKYENQYNHYNWSDNESNLRGLTLRISFSNQVKSKISFVKAKYRDNSTIKWLEYDGLCIYHLRYLMKMMNFTYTVVWTPGGTGFYNKMTGKFSGSLGHIQEGQADFSMPISLSSIRYAHFGSTTSLKDEPVKLFFRQARKLSQSEGAVWPFNATTWTLFISCTLTTIGLLWFAGWLLFQKSRECWPLDYIAGYVFATLLGQFPPIPSHVQVLISQRGQITVWIFCSLVLSCTYLSKMVGHLTIDTFEILPTNLNQLLEMDLKCGFTVIGAIYESFSTSKNPTFTKVFAKMEQFSEQFECVSKILRSEQIFVCATYEAVAQLYLLRNGYRLENSPILGSARNLFYGPVNIATRSRSRFLPNFNYWTQVAVDTGLSLRWDEMDLRAKRNAIISANKRKKVQNMGNGTITPSNNINDNQDEEVEVKLKHLTGPLYLFGSGLGLAGVVMIGEIFFKSFIMSSNAVISIS